MFFDIGFDFVLETLLFLFDVLKTFDLFILSLQYLCQSLKYRYLHNNIPRFIRYNNILLRLTKKIIVMITRY